MGEWREYRISDLLELKYGKDHKKLQDGNIPVYGSGGIMRYADKFLYDKESILIPRKGTLTNIFYINGEKPFWTVDTIFWSKINIELVFGKFLFYYLKTIDFTNLNVGSAVPSLTTKVLNEVDISLPLLKEQKAIAEVLSSLDDKINLLHRQNKTLEKLAQTLFRQWFIEEAKDEWEEVTIGDIAILKSGKSRPKTNDALNSIPIYGGNGILGYTSQYNAEDESIIIGRVGAYCGSLYIENKPIWVSDNALLAKPKNEIFSKFLFYLLKNSELNSMAEGSSHPLLTQGLIKSIPITLPPEKRLIKFNQQTNTWYEKINFNKEQIKTLKNIRDTLLSKLMSGEVKIKLGEDDV